MIHVGYLSEANIGRWDEFVESCADATFFHRAGWKEVVERAFGLPTYFLYAERDGQMEGVLPLGHVRSRMFGNALISTPYCVYGGIAANSNEAAKALLDEATRIANDLQVGHLELRHRSLRDSSVPTTDLYVTFRKEINPDVEANMLAVPRKQRAVIRKAIKAELSSTFDVEVGRFYTAYSESVRNLGTPVMPIRWFQIIMDVFGDACKILTVTKNDRPLSSVMSYYFRDEVLPYYGGGGIEARALRANDFMYWELMRRACEQGFRVFDYGRSKKNTGSYSFKKNWGFEPVPLPYEYHLVRATKVPEINPSNPKYQMFVRLWQRLPLGLSRFLGPMIAKNLA